MEGKALVKFAGLDDIYGLLLKIKTEGSRVRYRVLFETGNMIEADADLFELVPMLGEKRINFHISH